MIKKYVLFFGSIRSKQALERDIDLILSLNESDYDLIIEHCRSKSEVFYVVNDYKKKGAIVLEAIKQVNNDFYFGVIIKK